MKIKVLCIMLALSSTWAYAKPKFEDVRVFHTPSVDGLWIINGNKTAIMSASAGVAEITYILQAVPRGVFFKFGNDIVHIEETSWDEKKQGYSAYLHENESHEGFNFVVKPLDVYPKHFIQNVKLLHNSRRFSIFEKTASDVTFNIDTGEVVERNKYTSSGKSFKDGSMQFSILDENSAQMFGNQGSDSIAFYRDKKCLIFTETTASGSKHVLIISAKYDPSETGFRYLYVRNTLMFMYYIRTISHGIAKVDY